jgi:hypothetical protein
MDVTFAVIVMAVVGLEAGTVVEANAVGYCVPSRSTAAFT